MRLFTKIALLPKLGRYISSAQALVGMTKYYKKNLSGSKPDRFAVVDNLDIRGLWFVFLILSRGRTAVTRVVLLIFLFFLVFVLVLILFLLGIL